MLFLRISIVPKPHKVLLLKEAQKDLDSLSPKVVKQTLKALGRLAKNPNLAKKLSGDLSGVCSYRFGTPSGEFRIAFLSKPQNLHTDPFLCQILVLSTSNPLIKCLYCVKKFK